jgi:hypothetical protein
LSRDRVRDVDWEVEDSVVIAVVQAKVLAD